jgi:hypothetical protein
VELEPVGRVEDPQALDLGPITVPIVGYKHTPKGNVEVITKVKFKRRPPMKDVFERGESAKALTGSEQLAFLSSVLEDEAEAKKFIALIEDENIYVDWATIREVFIAVRDAWLGTRPTKQPSGSTPSSKPTKRTTGRAAPSKALASKKSR